MNTKNLFIIYIKRLLSILFSECSKSPTGQHEWSEARLEDSIDKDRKKEVTSSYCKYCYKSKKDYDDSKGDSQYQYLYYHP